MPSLESSDQRPRSAKLPTHKAFHGLHSPPPRMTSPFQRNCPNPHPVLISQRSRRLPQASAWLRWTWPTRSSLRWGSPLSWDSSEAPEVPPLRPSSAIACRAGSDRACHRLQLAMLLHHRWQRLRETRLWRAPANLPSARTCCPQPEESASQRSPNMWGLQLVDRSGTPGKHLCSINLQAIANVFCS